MSRIVYHNARSAGANQARTSPVTALCEMSAMRYRRGSAVRRNRSPTQAQFGRIAGYDSLFGVRDQNQTGDVRVTR